MADTPPPLFGPRLIWPFVFTTLPAIPVLIFAIRVFSSPEGWGVLLHPLGVMFFVMGLLMAALPIRLAIYIYSLRERSSIKRKVWAAIQCAVPGSVVFLFLLAILESGFTASRLLLLAFFGCYFAAFVILVAHIVHDLRNAKESTPIKKNV